MQGEEIRARFSPVLEVDNVQQGVLDSSTCGQALWGSYVSAEDQQVAEKVEILGSTTSGDAAVNDCTIQPLIPDLPFGGVGGTGMGKYHGEWGFQTYTSTRCSCITVAYRPTPICGYPPYSRQKPVGEQVAS